MTPLRTRLNYDELEKLLVVTSYRSFVEKLLELQSQNGRKFGYADIARFGGFSARSFPRNVVLGERNLTLKSMHKFILGMGLSGDLAEYFRLLVELEHEDCRVKPTTESQIRKALTNLRKRLLAKKSSTAVGGSAQNHSYFSAPYIPPVYAALGSQDKGATFEEILSRTHLKKDIVMKALETLMNAGIVEKRQQRYFAIENHLNFEGLSQSEVFQRFYLHLLEKALGNASASFSSGKNLHFCSAFSVKETDMPKLREDLRAVLLRYVDAAEFSEGNKVVSLACSLF